MKLPKLLFTAVLVFFLSACAAQRKPFRLGEIPDQGTLTQAEVELGAQVFNQLSQQYQLDENLANDRRVRDIVQNLSDATTKDGYGNPWHVYIFKDDNQKNAAATRGNYIFVWTGILNIVESDDELATILAHEVSHVLAKHTTPTPGEQANEALAKTSGQVARLGIAQSGYGALAGLGQLLVDQTLRALFINPNSQKLEAEADMIGLFLMAKAGYNPEKALKFWEKAAKDPDFGQAAFSFLSTHPSTGQRISKIEEYLPLAMDLYFKNRHIRRRY